MGSTYDNVTVLGVELETIPTMGQEVFLSARGDDVVLFPSGERVDTWDYAPSIAQQLGCVTVLAAVHDSDLLAMGFHRAGHDELFFTIPDPGELYGESELSVPPPPPAEAIVALVGRGSAERLATAMTDEFVFAEDRHAAVLEALDLPTAAVGIGHRYLTMDGLDLIEPPAQQLP